MANHQNAATLGIALDLQMGNFATEAQKVAYETQKMKNAIAREMKAADKEIQSLKYATEDYGNAVTKVTQIERELATGRLKDIKGTAKAQELLAQAAAYDKVANAAKNAAGATFKMNEQQKINLTYQTTDFFTQIASGQSPFIAALQQGGQLKDTMGGVGNMFRAIGSLFTPFTVGLGSVAAALGVVAYATYEAYQEFDKFQDSLTLTGNYSGTTANALVAMSRSIADATKTTVGTATEALDALVSSGKFTSTALESVTKAVLTYSKIAGVDGKQAAEALMSGLNGTAAGAKSLNDKMNFLTLAQYKQIEALEKAGKLQDAAKLTADILNGRLEAQKRILGDLETAWDQAKNAMSKFWASLKEAIAGPSTNVGILKKLNEEIEAIEFTLNKSTSPEKYKVAERERLQLLKERRKEIEEIIKKQEESEVPPEEKGGIGDYAAAGGFSKKTELNAAIAKAIANNQYLIDVESANERQKIELEAAKEIREKNLEFDKKSAEEKRVFGKLLADQLAAEIYTIELKRDEKLKAIRDKNRISEYEEFLRTQKEKTDADVARDIRLSAIRTSNQSKTREMEYQKESLELKYQMIYATEKEQRLAQISLEYARKRKEVEEGPDKQFNLDQINRQEEMAKMFVTMQESAKRTQQVFDSVFGNLSSAIDNFVKTGKLSMKDLARSIIQDLIAIQMKAMVLRFLGAAFANISAAGTYGTIPGSEQTNMLAAQDAGFGRRASGGAVTNNTPYLVGERGPELFMPSGSGTIIPNNQMGMGSTTNVTNNYINAIDVKSFEDRLLGSSNTIWAANQYANKNLSTNFGRT
jgi:phage-related minor tail protein